MLENICLCSFYWALETVFSQRLDKTSLQTGNWSKFWSNNQLRLHRLNKQSVNLSMLCSFLSLCKYKFISSAIHIMDVQITFLNILPTLMNAGIAINKKSFVWHRKSICCWSTLTWRSPWSKAKCITKDDAVHEHGSMIWMYPTIKLTSDVRILAL